MSGAPPQPISPPPGAAAQTGSGVRRHHTITATSRTARNAERNTIDEESQEWHHEDVGDAEWPSAVGALGEKGGNLHRQASLPTRYNRAYGATGGRQGGAHTPRTLNSLTAIDGQEGEEEDWEREMRDLRDEDGATYSAEHPQHQQLVEAQSQSSGSPLSPHFAAIPSPPLAGVRRHQSLTAASAAPKKMAQSGLRRAGTLQTSIRPPGHPQTPSPPEHEEYDVSEGSLGHEDDEYFNRQPAQYQNPTSPIGGRSPWGTPGGTDWRATGQAGAIDDVQRALSQLDMSGQGQAFRQANPYPSGQSTHPPRFNPSQPPPQTLMSGARPQDLNGQQQRKLALVTDFEDRQGATTPGGPASASAYVPPIGHGPSGPNHTRGSSDDRAFSASGTWDQKDRLLAQRTSTPNLHGAYTKNQYVPQVPAIPAQFLNQQAGAGRLNTNMPNQPANYNQQVQNLLSSPVDVPTLVATKGYNPTNFDTRPAFARYFVIKSYTEEDVHKSLKHEIWSSTDPGNKRLDKAFKENAGRGPIYLFFSVNASGHFCGMAEMLTPVDYTRSSTVWQSDKWKGVFSVKWIFVRDIPNAQLRHIRLNNTQERKPVTNSRDTQELLPEAGQEMLRIFQTHPSRTTLLQDFAYYELQAMQKQQQVEQPASHPTSPQPPHALPQQQYMGMQNANIQQAAYANQLQMQAAQMNPMMMANFMNPQAMQSLMRNPSPGPTQAYMGSFPSQ
ncbi:unnamed protein product [Peniophora sp. CBMAI 1063]|nr:unnamed protein product [Peniophora sp. CBMAI 1063]